MLAHSGPIPDVAYARKPLAALVGSSSARGGAAPSPPVPRHAGANFRELHLVRALPRPLHYSLSSPDDRIVFLVEFITPRDSSGASQPVLGR